MFKSFILFFGFFTSVPLKWNEKLALEQFLLAKAYLSQNMENLIFAPSLFYFCCLKTSIINGSIIDC